MMHVLIHVQDAYDVGAARGLPVVVHLLPGLGAVIQELWEGGTKGIRLISPTLPLLKEAWNLPKHQGFICEGQNENSNSAFPALWSSEPLNLRGTSRSANGSRGGRHCWEVGDRLEFRGQKSPYFSLQGKQMN